MQTKEQILKAYTYRQAIKVFREDKKISDEDFAFILETARLSPSSFGWEPWHFIVLQNPTIREKIKPFVWGGQTQLPTASHLVLILGRKAKEMKPGSSYLSYIAEKIQQLPEDIVKNKIDHFGSFQTNDFDLTDDRKIFDWVARQTYLPFANMMTAAASIGIDSCPMEGFSKKDVENILAEEHMIDTNRFGLVAIVAFGYKAKDLDWKKSRRSLNEMVTWVK